LGNTCVPLILKNEGSCWHRKSPQNDPTAEFPQGVPRRVLPGVPRGGGRRALPRCCFVVEAKPLVAAVVAVAAVIVAFVASILQTGPKPVGDPKPCPKLVSGRFGHTGFAAKLVSDRF
jgi:hypothetical protein